MKNTIPGKIFFVALIGILLPGFLHARPAGERTTNELTIYSIRGPSGVGLIRLFEDPPQIDGFNVRLEALAGPDLMTARFISGEAKIGILPPNMAAKIATEGIDVRAVAVIGTGMLSLLTNDPNLRSIADLRGRNVEVAAQGTTPDFVLRRILSFHGMDPERDVTFAYALAMPEIAQALIAGRVSAAILPEPFVTMARMGRPDLRAVSDIQQEWIRAGGGSNYPITLLVVEGAFADANPAAVQRIIDDVRTSIEWVIANPAEAGQMVEKHELGLRAPIVTAAIPNSNYVFIPALQARQSIEALLSAFLESNPSSVGGALPDDRFYYR